MVNRLVEPEGLAEETRAFAQELAEGPSLSIQMMKAVLNRSLDLDMDAVLQMEALTHGYVKQSWDHQEGVRAFLEKRKPQFRGD